MAINNNDNREDLFLGAKPENAPRQRPQMFDIEKSDEEYFGRKKPEQKAAGTQGYPNTAKPSAPSQPKSAQPIQPKAAAPKQPQSAPPIAPKKNVYKPGSFKELEPESYTYSKSIQGASEPTIAIPTQKNAPKAEKSFAEKQGENDEVKIYKAPPKDYYAGYVSKEPDVKLKPKQFKLNISDEDFNSIPDFDTRNNKPKVVQRNIVASAPEKPRYSYSNADYSDDYDDRRNKKTMRSLGRFANGVIYTLSVLFVSVILSVFIIQSLSDVLGLFKRSFVTADITLPKGATTSEIAKMLKEEKIISQPLTFTIYSKFRDYDGTYLDGSFHVESDMSYDEIMGILSYKNDEPDVVTITFIEGMTVRDIANELEKKNVCKAEDFIKTLQNEDFGYEFEELIPDSKDRYLKLEGYLFPDTYNFYVGENSKSVAKKFLKNFNRKITPDIIKRLEDIDMTLDEALTLASIIQKEAGTADEMYMVSSIFNNRLDKPKSFPLLQSDVTVFYVNDNITPFVSADKQTSYAAAYNTYKCEGLPVGPVCNRVLKP